MTQTLTPPPDTATAAQQGPKKGAGDAERLKWLSDTVAAALAARPELATAHVGISIRDTETGKELVAVKAGDPLTPEEIEALVAQKDVVEKSSNCPHGRPTTLRLTVKDLERQFKRT